MATSLPEASLIRTWPLQGGISAQMTAFEIEFPDATRKKLIARQPCNYKFRLDSEVAEKEFRLLQALQRAGLPVQTPYFVEPGSEEFTQLFFVIEFIEGSPDIDPLDRASYLSQYAEQLADIHSTDWRTLDGSLLGSQTDGYGRRPENLNELLREREIRDALESVSPRTGSNPPVLRHGDFWPGNVLWKSGEIVGVIDWEEALIGEPLADLAICRLDLLWVFGIDAMHAFTELCLTLMSLDLSALAYWDLCASLRPITNLHDWAVSYPQLGRPDVTVETMTRDHNAFVEQALAKLAR